MTGMEAGLAEWLGLISHIKRWLSNLRRASKARRLESRDALRDVIRAVRKSTVYTRHLREGGDPSSTREEELSLLWTGLSFKLEDLGLNKLAKRCRVSGIYWADPAALDPEFLARAGIGLREVEALARQSLAELDGH